MRASTLDLEGLSRIGDPEADELIQRVQHGRPAILFRLMTEVMRWEPASANVASSISEIDAFLLQPYRAPRWFNKAVKARVLRAQHKYQANRNVARIVLANYSLPALYIHPDIALALIGTGRLATHVRDRLDHTQAFVDAVMKPGALLSGDDSWRWICKVRLSHAIRRALAKVPRDQLRPALAGLVDGDPLAQLHRKVEWSKRHDEPVDQVELAYVLLTFSWVVADGVARLGYSYRMWRTEREDHIQAWAVIGHMLGIVDELLPGSPCMDVGDAQKLFEMLRQEWLDRGDPLPEPGMSPQPGVEEGRLLMAALMVVLVDVLRENIPGPLRGLVAGWPWLDLAIQDLPRTLVYKLAGTPTARLLHVAPAPLLHWIVCRLLILVIDLRKLKADGALNSTAVVGAH